MLEALFLILVIILIILGVFLLSPPKHIENKKNFEETANWEYYQELAKKESEAEKNKEWFSESRWLSDKEIDWAVERMEKDEKFKALPAYQFYYVGESRGKKEAKAELAFGELVKELTDFKGGLVFIPVNNPNFHWSLLVYENSAKKFYHYDTLGGANWKYIKPLCKELLQKIHSQNVELDNHLIKQHDLRQGNGYDCGVAATAIIKRIRKLWKQSWWDWINSRKFKLGDDLGEFDFGKERNSLREEYLKEKGGN